MDDCPGLDKCHENETLFYYFERFIGTLNFSGQRPDFRPAALEGAIKGFLKAEFVLILDADYRPDHSKNSVIDYKPNSSCNSPSKDMKNSLPVAGGGVVGTNSLSYGGQMPVLPVRNNLRRPNSSHFPPAASRFHFRKGLASRCTWKCTAIALIVLCVILTAALSYISDGFLHLLCDKMTEKALTTTAFSNYYLENAGQVNTPGLTVQREFNCENTPDFKSA
ncbi:hypothetical protein YQE_11436, partial [Dendroctonus ponderosae]